MPRSLSPGQAGLHRLVVWVGNSLLIAYIALYVWHGLHEFRTVAAWTVIPYLALEVSQAAMILVHRRARVPAVRWRESAFPFLVSFWMIAASAVWSWHSAWGPEMTAVLSWLRLGPVVGATWAILTLGRNFAMAVEVRQVVQHGVYRYIRHPIYTAYGLLWGIQVVLFRSWSYTGVVVVGVILLVIRAHYEDVKLRQADATYGQTRRGSSIWRPTVLLRSRRSS